MSDSMSSWGTDNGGAFSGSDSWSGYSGGTGTDWGIGDGAFGGSDDWFGGSTDALSQWGMGDIGATWDTPSTDAFGSPIQQEDDGLLTKLRGLYGEFSKSPIGKVAKMGMSIANPALGGVLGIADMASAAAEGKGGQAIGQKFGNAIQGQLGPVGQLGNMFGVGLGDQMGKAIGGVNYTGPATSDNNNGYSGYQATTPFGSFTLQGNTNSQDYGKTLMGLASLWAQRNNMNNMKRNAGGLSGMYGKNSPYTKQLGQTLARKDAAAGRRSQYGAREVDLQAKLAALRSQNAPALSSMYQNIGQNENNFYAQLANMYGNGGFGPFGG